MLTVKIGTCELGSLNLLLVGLQIDRVYATINAIND